MASTASPSNAQVADMVESWSKQLAGLATGIRHSESPQISPEQRFGLIGTAMDILKTFKQPQERLMESMVVLAEIAALRMFVKWNVFDMILEAGTMSYGEIAAKLDAETSLITRLSWTLVSTGLLKQIGKDQVTLTEGSKIFVSTSPMKSLLENGFDNHLRAISFMPDYFDKYPLKEPVGRRHTIQAFAAGNPEMTIWEHMLRDQTRMTSFMTAMVAASRSQPTVGPYDFSWLVEKAKESEDRALVVDVGGGQGHALEAILKATPGLPASRCVVEDLPNVTVEAKPSAQGDLANAQFVPMDFHSEQPVKGALIYYIRRCLHDYGDEDSIKILKQLQAAMANDSKVVIVEELLENPPSPLASATDIFMATIGGKERTLENFEAITEAAGLKIVEAHRCKGSGFAIIECIKI